MKICVQSADALQFASGGLRCYFPTDIDDAAGHYCLACEQISSSFAAFAVEVLVAVQVTRVFFVFLTSTIFSEHWSTSPMWVGLKLCFRHLGPRVRTKFISKPSCAFGLRGYARR